MRGLLECRVRVCGLVVTISSVRGLECGRIVRIDDDLSQRSTDDMAVKVNQESATLDVEGRVEGLDAPFSTSARASNSQRFLIPSSSASIHISLFHSAQAVELARLLSQARPLSLPDPDLRSGRFDPSPAWHETRARTTSLTDDSVRMNLQQTLEGDDVVVRQSGQYINTRHCPFWRGLPPITAGIRRTSGATQPPLKCVLTKALDG